MNDQVISKVENEDEVTFTLKCYYTSKSEPDHYYRKTTVFKTKESAGMAAGSACKSWGSNLVYLGCSHVGYGGEIYYENKFNIWD